MQFIEPVSQLEKLNQTFETARNELKIIVIEQYMKMIFQLDETDDINKRQQVFEAFINNYLIYDPDLRINGVRKVEWREGCEKDDVITYELLYKDGSYDFFEIDLDYQYIKGEQINQGYATFLGLIQNEN